MVRPGDRQGREYLEARIVEGRGGHCPAFEVEGFAAAIDANAGQVVVARATEVVALRGGPLGEVVMTISVGGISMPFVVLFDEENDLVLVATDATGDGPVSVVSESIANGEMAFRSLTHWQRDFQRCWPLEPGVEFEITWRRGRVFLTAAGDGSVVRLAEHRAPPPGVIEEQSHSLGGRARGFWGTAGRRGTS